MTIATARSIQLACPRCGEADQLATVEQLLGSCDMAEITVDQTTGEVDAAGLEHTEVNWDDSQSIGVQCGACGWQHIGHDWSLTLTRRPDDTRVKVTIHTPGGNADQRVVFLTDTDTDTVTIKVDDDAQLRVTAAGPAWRPIDTTAWRPLDQPETLDRHVTLYGVSETQYRDLAARAGRPAPRGWVDDERRKISFSQGDDLDLVVAFAVEHGLIYDQVHRTRHTPANAPAPGTVLIDAYPWQWRKIDGMMLGGFERLYNGDVRHVEVRQLGTDAPTVTFDREPTEADLIALVTSWWQAD